MYLLFDIIAWIMSFIGHLGLWSVGYNRVHATAWPRRQRKVTEKIVLLAVILPAFWVLSVWFSSGSISFAAIYDVSRIAHAYGVVCLLLSVYFVLRFCWRKITYRLPSAIVSSSERLIDLESQIGLPLFHGTMANVLSKIPGNQSAQLALESKTIALDQLPNELDGLRVCHLSDLHFTGDLGIEYFIELAGYINEFEPDLILLTGDIIDSRKCVPWIEDVLGIMKAKYGIYYVLGNHDLRIRDEQLIRETLAKNGLVPVGGDWLKLSINGAEIMLAGNELPWFTGAERLPVEPPSNGSQAASIKILMSHSPDQIDWASNYGFDLMLCGHTHGGQIRFPVIGPVVAPSRYGVKYCGGTFEIGKMLMHVSRGVSGDDLIRLNCPPEVGLFTLASTDNA